MKVGNIQYKVYTDNVNVLCCNSKNIHKNNKYQVRNSGYLREEGKVRNTTRVGVYRDAGCIHFYLKQKANMAKC